MTPTLVCSKTVQYRYAEAMLSFKFIILQEIPVK